MAGNPKFGILEKDGVEYGGLAEYIPEAEDFTVDDSTLPYTAANGQEALEQAAAESGSSRYAVAFGRLGAVNVQPQGENPGSPKYLRNYYGPTTDDQPFIIPETSELVSVVVQVDVDTTATFELLLNDVVIQTINLVNESILVFNSLATALAAYDELSGRVSAGNTQDPVMTIHVKVTNG